MKRIHCAAFVGLLAASGTGCGDAVDLEAVAGDPERDAIEAGPLEVSVDQEGRATIGVPEGEFNAFFLDAVWNDVDEAMDGGLAAAELTSVSSRTIYSAMRTASCRDCLLPRPVRIGELIDGFELEACLLAEDPAEDDCTLTRDPVDIEGLTLDDLNNPFPSDDTGGRSAIDGFVVSFCWVSPEADAWVAEGSDSAPLPRIDTVSAELRITSDGTLEVVSDWLRCNDALNRPCAQ
jgi:hypothetical protein